VFRRLDSGHLERTTVLLRRRIDERFPGSGLGRVAGELETVTSEAVVLASDIARPQWILRGFVSLGLLVMLGLLGAVVYQLREQHGSQGWSDFLQGVEALVNDLIFAGFAVYFLLGVETRRKRKRVLSALHTLRSLAHIVDMHQLTKDPEQLVSRGPRTESSPERTMTPFELNRYLDYASEMLAIMGKVAALYVQDFDDPVALNAASDLQDLTVNLSRSIWQKIVILARDEPSVRDALGS
jgi:hypothetical protein